MDDIEKLFRKISPKDRIALRSLVESLLSGKKISSVKKLSNSDFYRVRKGRFRIIFHYNQRNEAVIDSIKLRNKNTYKNF